MVELETKGQYSIHAGSWVAAANDLVAKGAHQSTMCEKDVKACDEDI